MSPTSPPASAAVAPECDWDTPENPSYTEWTTVNVAEVIPGVSLPLNATWFQATEKGQMRAFVGSFGASDLVPVYDEPYPNFIGFFAGRAALNIGFVMALLSTYQTGAGSSAAEQFFTADEAGGYAVPTAADPERAARNRARTFRVWGQLPRAIAADRAQALRLGAQLGALNSPSTSLRQMWAGIDRIANRCGRMGSNHLLASYAGSEYSSLLMQLLAEHLPDVPAEAVVQLTSALDVESAEPSVALWELSRWIRTQPALADALARRPIDEIDARLASPPDPAWRAFAGRFAALLAAHGFHGRNEISLTTPDWSEDHTFPLNSLRTLAGAGDDASPIEQHRRAGERRRALEIEYRQRLPAGARRAYDRLLERAQTFVRMRETTKTTLIRAIRPGRPLLLELGRRLVEDGALDQAEDFYYLFYHEIEAGMRGGFDPAVVRAAVARRRRQYQTLQGYRLPDNFVGLPEVLPAAPVGEDPRHAEAGVGTLTGLGVSGGIARGRARVILDVDEADRLPLQPGEVLVAPLTDAPWTPLFLTAAAVVVETGGLLSHAATVAREFGIPAVAMVTNATRLIRDGQMITVDGTQGRVALE